MAGAFFSTSTCCSVMNDFYPSRESDGIDYKWKYELILQEMMPWMWREIRNLECKIKYENYALVHGVMRDV